MVSRRAADHARNAKDAEPPTNDFLAAGIALAALTEIFKKNNRA